MKKVALGLALAGAMLAVAVASADSPGAAARSSEPAPTATRADAKAGPLVRFVPPWTSPFHVDPRWPTQLVNAQGRHLFILNRTEWAYFGCKDPAGVLDRAAAQGVNVIRVCLEGRPYFKQLGVDLWPWAGTRQRPVWSSFNAAYWREVERRVRLAGQKGIGLDIVLYFTLHPSDSQVAQQKAYWQEVLRRLGPYANVLTWEIANEYTANETFQDAAGMYLLRHDGYHRPICTSAGTTDNAVWPDKPWMGLAINHSCTGSRSLRDWYLAVARRTASHGKPAFCNESGREKRHHNDDGIARRKQGWLWCAAGAFWTYHSWSGCEGINDPTYRGPGSEFLKPMATFFRALPFWELKPTASVVALPPDRVVSTALARAGASLVVAYLCTPKTHQTVTGLTATLHLPAGRYRLALIRPADGATLRTRGLTSEGPGVRVALPRFTDDLAMVIRRQDGRPKTAGTMPSPD